MFLLHCLSLILDAKVMQHYSNCKSCELFCAIALNPKRSSGRKYLFWKCFLCRRKLKIAIKSDDRLGLNENRVATAVATLFPIVVS